MLTGKMVRVRYARERILPYYIALDEGNRLLAEQLIELFRGMVGSSRGELEELLNETFGDDVGTLLHQGLAKLLEDLCEFEVAADHPPETIREAVFTAAAEQRQGEVADDERAALARFDREAVLTTVAARLGLAAGEVERCLFADLKSDQKLMAFKEPSVEALLNRYNVALAQAVLIRAIRVHVTIEHEPPARYRQLLRAIKFHRLICEVERVGPERYTLHLDGPMSLFAATQKYGLQLALFLPAVLLCQQFELKAELRWGPQRKPKTFLLSHKDRLVTHAADHGMYTPAELRLFVESFRKRIAAWELHEETEVQPLGNGFWVPDFRLVHKASGKSVLLEVLGFWRKSSAMKHLDYLKRYVRQPFLLAVSDQLHVEEALDDLPAGIHRFRHMPLADEVARLAAAAVEV